MSSRESTRLRVRLAASMAATIAVIAAGMTVPFASPAYADPCGSQGTGGTCGGTVGGTPPTNTGGGGGTNTGGTGSTPGTSTPQPDPCAQTYSPDFMTNQDRLRDIGCPSIYDTARVVSGRVWYPSVSDGGLENAGYHETQSPAVGWPGLDLRSPSAISNWHCGGTNRYYNQQDMGSWLGFNYSYTSYYFYNGSASGRLILAEDISVSCISPPLFRIGTVDCALTVYGSGQGPTGNPVVSPRNFSQTWPTAYSRSINAANPWGSLTACRTPLTVGFTFPSREWGRYRVALEADKRDCTYRDYFTADPRTGVIPTDVIIGCGAVYRVLAGAYFWQVWCGGVYDDGTDGFTNRGWTFTSADCPGTYTCSAAGVPTLDGVRWNKPVYADGKPHTGVWVVQRPSGSARGMTGLSTVWNVDTNSSPWRGRDGSVGPDPGQGGDSQFFSAQHEYGSLVTGSQSTLREMRWFKAGLSGEGWQVRPTWTFKGEFLSPVPGDIGIDVDSGDISIGSGGSAWVVGQGACTGPWLGTSVTKSRLSD